MDRRNGQDNETHVLSQQNRLQRLEETPLEFPVDFSIKVIGRDQDGFRDLVLDVLDVHFASVARDKVNTRPSRAGKYTALTATVRADSKDQLEAAYAALTDLDEVLWAL